MCLRKTAREGSTHKYGSRLFKKSEESDWNSGTRCSSAALSYSSFDLEAVKRRWKVNEKQ